MPLVVPAWGSPDLGWPATIDSSWSGKVPFVSSRREPSSAGCCYMIVDRGTVNNCNLNRTTMQCTKVIQGQLGGAPTVTKRTLSQTSTTAKNAGASVKSATVPQSEPRSTHRWWVHLLDENDQSMIIDSRAFDRKAEARRFWIGAIRVYGDHRVMLSSKKLGGVRRQLAETALSLSAVAS